MVNLTRMTVAQYEKELKGSLQRKLYDEAASFFSSLTEETKTRDYWLVDVRDALIPSRGLTCKVRLRGHSLEIGCTIADPIAVFGNEVLCVGGKFKRIESKEEAISTLRFLVGRLKELEEEYESRMKEAELEVMKSNMIVDIGISAVKSQLQNVFVEVGRSGFSFSAKNEHLLVKYNDKNRGKTKMFRVRYENMAEDMKTVRDWCETELMLTPQRFHP